MDSIFKALSDDTRRQLLDRLREKDGQTLTQLEGALGMTRFGVMKHLKVLEAATLIVTRRAGRFKFHYLNAAPLQMLVDRWIEPLTQQPLTRVVLDLKAHLERPSSLTPDRKAKPDFVLETYIRTSPEKLWEALTQPQLSKLYYLYGATLQGQIKTGELYTYQRDGTGIMLSGRIIEADPPRRLEMTFCPGWAGPNAKASRNVFEISAESNLTKLTILHFDLPEGQEGVKTGWAQIASSLKSFLETGEGLGDLRGSAR
jgi:uncharacterized protein YndB with AHSA1/START domain/DNA-binding transcriptional ArsR family regulator